MGDTINGIPKAGAALASPKILKNSKGAILPTNQ
jgi:hypothetical protein